MKKSILILFLFCAYNQYFSAQEQDIYRISAEQKAYELSVVWKEISYNFANMDNCPDVNLDSLYRAYIPLVTDTKNDFEYFRAMQKFLANFNNGHVSCDRPDYLYQFAAYPLFTTNKKDGRIFVDKFCKIYPLQKDDEILSVNNLSTSEYIDKFLVPYTTGSNLNAKRKNATIGYGGINLTLNSDNEKLILTIKRKKNIEKVEVPFICYNDYRSDTIKYQQIIDFYYKDLQSTQENIFIVDKKNDFAYIKLSFCDENFQKFYLEKYDTILNFNNLILDLSNNGGGDGRVTSTATFSLTDVDSVRWFDLKTRINNAHYKAKAASRIYFFKPDEVTQDDKDKFYPFFYNNAFEIVETDNFKNPIPSEERYKGNVYVIVNENTGSAAEQIVLMLQHSNKVSILGKQTSGSLGQPLTIKLDSGLNVFINTSKTYNIKGQDVSSGIKPDYEYDFSNFYNIKNPQERLKKFIEVIKNLKK